MTTYNFSVRATDNLGAYADRAFDITVNNTSIERFVAVGSLGLAHSRDGIKWTYEASLSGNYVSYGNGSWVICTGGLTVRTSPDAVNWTTYTMALPFQKLAGNGGAQTDVRATGIDMIKFIDGEWRLYGNVAMVQNSNLMMWALEYRSSDLVTWTYVSSTMVQSYSTGGSVAVSDVTLDPISGKLVMALNYSYYNGSRQAPEYAYYIRGRTDATWTRTFSESDYDGTPIPKCTVVCTNGLWCATSGGNYVFTSFNGTDWVRRTFVTGGAYLSGLTYSNGRLITREYNPSANYGSMWGSLDGGRSWTKLSSFNVNAPNYYNNGIRRASMVSYGGVLLSADMNPTYALTMSTDDGTTVSPNADAGLVAIQYTQAVAVRTV